MIATKFWRQYTCFRESDYTTRAPWRLPNVWISFELKMASVNWKPYLIPYKSTHRAVLLPDPENMGIAVGIPFLSCIQAEICVMLCHIYFRLQATISDFLQIHTSSSLCSSLVLLPDPENMGIAVGISLLSCIEADIYVMSILLLAILSDVWVCRKSKMAVNSQK